MNCSVPWMVRAGTRGARDRILTKRRGNESEKLKRGRRKFECHFKIDSGTTPSILCVCLRGEGIVRLRL
jgi:hypothetical protein